VNKKFISVSNTKLIKSGKLEKLKIGTYALDPLKTCKRQCKGCYFQRLKRFPSVINRANERYYETLKKDWVERTAAEIAKNNIQVMRLHYGGDIYSDMYMCKLISLACKLPDVLFYGYTKRVLRVKKYNRFIPTNLIFIFSLGGPEDKYINTETDRHAKVFKDSGALYKAAYHNAMDNDLEAVNPNKLKIGLIYHGALSFEKSDFNK